MPKPIETLTTLDKKPPTILINMVVVATKSQKNEEQVFKEKEMLKNKTTIDWTKEEKMRKTFVETI